MRCVPGANPENGGRAGRAALELATRVMASIQEHGERVQLATLAARSKQTNDPSHSCSPGCAITRRGCAPSTRRRPTTMDDRTLVPAMLPIVTLDGKRTIPALCRWNPSPREWWCRAMCNTS